MAAVDVRDVGYRYPDGHEVLRDVSLSVREGERVAVLGPNGAGKTTLMLLLAGLLQPTTGTASVAGTVLDPKTVREVRRRIGIVFQIPDDQLFMPTVAADVAFGLANYGVTGEDLDRRVAEALADVGLSDVAERAPHHLSVGQQRRAALAGILAMRPDCVVLDEPSANLDPAARRQLVDVVRREVSTLILVTHDLPYALQMCSRAVILDDGRVAAEGPVAEILADGALLEKHSLELPFGFSLRAALAELA
ncbi:energy-coupling factor ABC transporter ATP-binding protein [Haloglycomyces albus]|uniref:energy-coupling factor ABC transporter ATP-binding protein n=1 Tax=Haloglycomyces albus TaxID=526067 RepID=UPI0004A38611|nr:ABC transporter ATP-binding protein [Haloglycomyces albus]